ncbi:MAG: homocitrate synthase [Omnitrophica WOR_2 bacterium GWF2_43_52]|nr:MAG: homocitrate synthase [Omnitrophica WOR_2 bacterium GWA2_44_7]OGX21941.1 MAG: homocitrate synthase [Omnitrophica WOR_2 bacterium GWF2_43_52]OGX55786.1 MAG: homocitrate synthase [Omnitrophica WOR_2 bacterium RIFOXYC2_FULL_43_9]HAH20050.1 homocitrate synthase [Candidatus Omnitrophota bacterium]HBG63091.1 homocitrate synthase [Candidatus Omnitrophota bacterium]
MKQPKVYILDVTNRDGVQTSRICLSKLEKTMINFYLNQMGVAQSEFGFPVTHHETNYLNANLELAEKGVLKPICLSGWMRATRDDVRASFKQVPKLKHINLSISTSDQMIVHKFKGKLDHASVIKEMEEAVTLAKKHGAELIGVNAEDASRTRMDYLIEFSSAAKDAGAHRIRYCDTLGCDNPFVMYDRIKILAESVKLPMEIHCHNDLGMVVANSIAGAKAALDAGVDSYINTCVNGMGERAGNADLVSVILALKYAHGFEGKDVLDEHIDLKAAWKICKYASYAFGVPIPINQPGVGANAFAHESGIHADGALKDRKNYELYDFEELGRGEPEIIETGRKITAGEYSGIKGFRNVYEKLEVEFKDDAQATEVLELVRYANVHSQKPLVDDELKFIAKHPEIARKIFTMAP